MATDLGWDTGTRAGASINMEDWKITVLENKICIQVLKKGELHLDLEPDFKV